MEVGIFIAKYSFQFKKEVVNAFLNGEGGYKFLATKYHIQSFNNVKKWVLADQAYGDN